MPCGTEERHCPQASAIEVGREEDGMYSRVLETESYRNKEFQWDGTGAVPYKRARLFRIRRVFLSVIIRIEFFMFKTCG